MRSAFRFGWLLLAPWLFTPGAMAQTVHVPADHVTIQGAIDSGATLIYVAEGTYPESLVVAATVTLLPEPPANPMAAPPYPRVWGLSIGRGAAPNPVVSVRGFHFTGSVRVCNSNTNGGRTLIEGCRLDAGFTTTCANGIGETVHLRSCLITGDVYIDAYGADFTGNTVLRGEARVHSNGLGAVIRDNVVIGPSARGLSSTSGDAPGLLTGNFVSGVATAYTVANGTASGNVAEDCVRGYVIEGPTWGTAGRFRSNVARRCETGFELTARSGLNEVTGNEVDSCRGVGIHIGASIVAIVRGNGVTVSGSHGIWHEGYLTPSANRVLHAGGDGIRAFEGADSNVVGRCAGRGIVTPAASYNTVYSNAGHGIEASGNPWSPVSLTGNLSYGNGGFGLLWTGGDAVTLGCNDWFGNVGGATSGVAPGASDAALDPLFCNLPEEDVTLSSGSPLLSRPGCTPIGALGAGCANAVGVTPSEGAATRLTVRPNPTRGAVELRWARTSAAGRIEVFDLAGSLRWRAELAPGAEQMLWSGADSNGQRLPGGIYFVRHMGDGVAESVRLVLVR